jgi:DNA-binding response OmpR family regulator
MKIIAQSILEPVERVDTAGEAVMRRILVVDDDPHICLAIRAWLNRYGFKVAIADGGTSGLVALDNSTFDLMIVDIFMMKSSNRSRGRILQAELSSVD